MDSALKIAADDNIPLIASACAELGDVTLFDARDTERVRRLVRESDVLLCRSTIRVDEELLDCSPVRFVATATSGTEHVEVDFLSKRGIAFASAAGSNARSVAEYVFAALFRLARLKDFDPARLSIGIIGVGHAGSEVERIARALGMDVLLNDPPRRDAGGGPAFLPLEEVLRADIVTMHVPLTRQGKYPTEGFMGEDAFGRMRNGVVFINTSRGGVLDETALVRASTQGKFRGLALDVFRGEPAFNLSILSVADIATPHIAGHSHDGKLLGTQMVYDRLCAFLGTGSDWNFRQHIGMARIAIPSGIDDPEPPRMADSVLRLAYDIEEDDAALRRLAGLSKDERGRGFASLRSEYRVRREFNVTVLEGEMHGERLAAILRGLGFTLAADESGPRDGASNVP